MLLRWKRSITYLATVGAIVGALAIQRPLAAEPLRQSLTPGPTSESQILPVPNIVQIERIPSPLNLVAGQSADVTLRLAGRQDSACLGAPLRAVDAMFVFDTSSSAGQGQGSNWERTQQMTQQLISVMGQPVFRTIVNSEQSQIGLITIKVGTLGPEPALLSALTDQYQQISTVIANVNASGDTDLSGGIRLAANELSKTQADRAQAIVLMLHDSVAISDRTIAAVQEVESRNIPVYVVVNSRNITENPLTREIAGRLVPDAHIFIDPQSTDLHQLFVRFGQGEATLAARLLHVEERVTPANVVSLSSVIGDGLVRDGAVAWNLPTIDQGAVVEMKYQITWDGSGRDPVTIQTRVDYIDCNGFPYTTIAPQQQVRTQIPSLVTPSSAPFASLEPPPITPTSESVILPPSNSVTGVPNPTTAPTRTPLGPDRERSEPWPFWIWWLLLIPLLLFLMWLVLALFRRRIPPSPPPGPSGPEPTPVPFDPSVPPTWITNFDRGDPLSESGKPLYPQPKFKDTLIIGVGEVGAMVLDQMAPDLQRRFAEYPDLPRNVRLLFIDVQPTGATRTTLAYQPTRLSADQMVLLQPKFSDVDETLSRDREKCPHLWWWEGNRADDCGRAAGRMALFYDLLNGTESSIIWQTLQRTLEDLRDPLVWVVTSTFDDIGSGMAVDLARITRLVRQREVVPSLFLSLPANCWSGPDQSEQSARSIATLREIERLMRNADVPFIYNPFAGQVALDQWIQESSPIGQVYLFDAAKGNNESRLDLTDIKAQVGIAALMSDSLMALIESDLQLQFQQQFNPLIAAAGTLINTNRQSVVGSFGCYSKYMPIDAIRSALEERAIHELLFADQVGLLPVGQFDAEVSWQSLPIEDLLAARSQAGNADSDTFITSLGINPKELGSLTSDQYASIRTFFLRRLMARADEYLNGSGVGHIYEQRHGGLLRTYAWTQALYNRLMRVKQPDIQQCARWTSGLRAEIQRWLEDLIGSLDGVAQPDLNPLVPLTLHNYLHQRSNLQDLRSSPVREPLLDAQLDLPFYQRAIRDLSSVPSGKPSEAMARMLKRVGWWCQAPEEGKPSATWNIQLVILPAGFERESPATFRNYAYQRTNHQGVLHELRALARIFSREALEGSNLSQTVTSQLANLNPRNVKDATIPRISYDSLQVAHLQLKGQLYVAVPQDEMSTQFVQRLQTTSAELKVIGVATSDPYACRILHAIYPIPIRATTIYNDEAWADYYNSRQLHVFPAEQHAVELEETRLLKERRVRLSPDLVHLFSSESETLAEMFGLCWIYDLLRIQSTGQYQLELADGQMPNPLLFNDSPQAIWNVFNDLVSYRHQADRLAPLSRTRRSDTVKRIQAALQQKRTALGDRAQRMAWLDQWKQQKIEPLRRDDLPPVAKDLAYFLEVIVERERR